MNDALHIIEAIMKCYFTYGDGPYKQLFDIAISNNFMLLSSKRNPHS